MRRIFKQESLLQEFSFLIASGALVFVVVVLFMRLWYLQIYQGDYYRKISETNRIRRIEIPSPRGLIVDRNGEVILGNRPFYDLVYVPQYVKDKEVTLKILSRLFHIPVSSFEERIKAEKIQPRFLPIILKRNLSLHEVSTVESNKVFLPGIEVSRAPRREYGSGVPAHVVGYLGEISPEDLKKFNLENDENPYFPGDLVGKQGLEARWENHLRGKRGYRLIQVDAFGRQVDPSGRKALTLPIVPAVPGSDVVLTIDKELQQVARDAFSGKNGAVVAIRPSDGAILAMLSEPGFDPNAHQTGISAEDWRILTQDPFHPLLDKTTGGEFAPGSVYKTVVAMAALEEGIITKDSTHFCPGSFTLGNRTYHCHDRKGHGTVDLRQALVKSCDVYFYHLGVELGADRIAKYAMALGLGRRLGVNLNMERPGLVPTTAWKKMVMHAPWIGGENPPVAIGQGYNLITPVQMANLFSTVANSGKVWRPYLVDRVIDHLGKTVYQHQAELIEEVKIIKPETFALVQSMLQDVVMSPEGTGHRAAVKGVTVAGKTGSVQVVSLKRNPKEADVSMKWKEHAMFAAFSPVENAEIAVAVVSENDVVGGGGKSAAPVAQKIIQAYWDLKKKRGAVVSQLEKKTTGVQ